MRLVLAGSERQFYDWCAENHVNPHHRDTRAKYISNYNDFFGIEGGGEIILFGTYWDNPLHADFEQWEFLLGYGKKQGWKLPEGF
jgi:hypothetical protein